jgi:hypothetical protein
MGAIAVAMSLLLGASAPRPVDVCGLISAGDLEQLLKGGTVHVDATGNEGHLPSCSFVDNNGGGLSIVVLPQPEFVASKERAQRSAKSGSPAVEAVAGIGAAAYQDDLGYLYIQPAGKPYTLRLLGSRQLMTDRALTVTIGHKLKL